MSVWFQFNTTNDALEFDDEIHCGMFVYSICLSECFNDSFVFHYLLVNHFTCEIFHLYGPSFMCDKLDVCYIIRKKTRYLHVIGTRGFYVTANAFYLHSVFAVLFAHIRNKVLLIHMSNPHSIWTYIQQDGPF